MELYFWTLVSANKWCYPPYSWRLHCILNYGWHFQFGELPFKKA